MKTGSYSQKYERYSKKDKNGRKNGKQQKRLKMAGPKNCQKKPNTITEKRDKPRK